MESLFIPLALAAGGLLTVQAGANAQLAKAIGSPFTATTLQLSVAAVLLLAIAVVTGSVAAFASLPGARWWHILGGVASAIYVVSTIFLFPRIGAVVSVGLFIAGQMLASAVLDSFGLLGVAAVGVDAGGAAGTLIVLLGAALIVFGQKGAAAEVGWSNLGWMALALIAGAVLPIQGAVNALLHTDLGCAAFAVGTISFVVATAAMAAVIAAGSGWLKIPAPCIACVAGMPWWGWLGGFAGAIYVTTMFTAIPAIGAGAAAGLTVVGQQVASVFVDKQGWFRLPQRPVSRLRLFGVALLLVGVGLIKWL
jgi:bacterial/archaeal transporter family-2 protein